MEEFEGDQMAYVFLKKKETYRVSIRRTKINQALQDRRQRVFQSNTINSNSNNNANTQQLLQSIVHQASANKQGNESNNIAFHDITRNGEINKEEIRSFFSQQHNQQSILNEVIEWFQQVIQNFQSMDSNKFSDQIEELKQSINLACIIEEISNTQIILLNDILFLTRMMNVNDVQQKLQVIDVFGMLYESNYLKQNIIQYFIQYINMDKIELNERILDIFIEKLSQFDSSLLNKLSLSFFQKTFMRLLNLKVESVSIRIIKVAKILIDHNKTPNAFMESLLDNQSNLSQLLVSHLEFKNVELLKEISTFVCSIIHEKEDSEEQIQTIIQSLIDSQFISKIFEIFTSQSREYQFLKLLIITIFSNANHFQIEHFFDTKLKYFIMNHLINSLSSPQNQYTLQVLQFIHQILYEEDQYSQQNYYPRKKIIQSLDLQAFINDLMGHDDKKISNEVFLIQQYL